MSTHIADGPQVISITAPQSKSTSGMAIAGFVLSLIGISVLGLIFSAVAFPQTKADGTHNGRGFAIAGLVLGILGCIGWALIIGGVFAGTEAAYSELNSYGNCVDAAQTVEAMADC